MPTVANIEIPVDDPKQATNFYSKLFGWEFKKPVEALEYYLVETDDLEGKPGPTVGLAKKEAADQRMINYIGVSSVDEYIEKVKQLGGEILMPKTAVPGWGYFANCKDIDSNAFGLWEDDESAK